jgi:hypothetical protein
MPRAAARIGSELYQNHFKISIIAIISIGFEKHEAKVLFRENIYLFPSVERD